MRKVSVLSGVGLVSCVHPGGARSGHVSFGRRLGEHNERPGPSCCQRQLKVHLLFTETAPEAAADTWKSQT